MPIEAYHEEVAGIHWDALTVPSGLIEAQTKYRMFGNTRRQAGQYNPDTSMTHENYLPAPNRMLVERLAVEYWNSNRRKDMQRFIAASKIELWVGDKRYLDLPLMFLSSMLENYAINLRFRSIHGQGLIIEDQRLFHVNIYVEKEITLKSPISLSIGLIGLLFRSVC